MLALWIAFAFLALSAFLLFGVPMLVLGPKLVLARVWEEADGRVALGTFATVLLAVAFAPHFITPLISAGDIAQVSAENFNRLHWSA